MSWGAGEQGGPPGARAHQRARYVLRCEAPQAPDRTVRRRRSSRLTLCLIYNNFRLTTFKVDSRLSVVLLDLHVRSRTALLLNFYLGLGRLNLHLGLLRWLRDLNAAAASAAAVALLTWTGPLSRTITTGWWARRVWDRRGD
jgi:hypothetical protein